ncbi:MAG: hypothetical protein Q7T06_09660, partial [Herminiimonas sp.]|nr:hypothetical protein [Herminiimonas sp.]
MRLETLLRKNFPFIRMESEVRSQIYKNALIGAQYIVQASAMCNLRTAQAIFAYAIKIEIRVQGIEPAVFTRLGMAMHRGQI